MTPNTQVEIVHTCSGRLRLKVSPKSELSRVAEQFRAIDGVQDVSYNLTTGSLLIVHQGSYEELITNAQSNSLFEFKQKPSHKDTVLFNTVIKGFFKDINQFVKKYTGYSLDLSSVTFIILVVLAGYQISRGNFTVPAWYTALWYAMNILTKNDSNKQNP